MSGVTKDMLDVLKADFESLKGDNERLRAQRAAAEQETIDAAAGEILRGLGVAPKSDPASSPPPGAATTPKRPADPVADMLAAIERQRGRG